MRLLHAGSTLTPPSGGNLLLHTKLHTAAKKLEQYELGRKCRKTARLSCTRISVTVWSHLPKTSNPAADCGFEGPKDPPGLYVYHLAACGNADRAALSLALVNSPSQGKRSLLLFLDEVLLVSEDFKGIKPQILKRAGRLEWGRRKTPPVHARIIRGFSWHSISTTTSA